MANRQRAKERFRDGGRDAVFSRSARKVLSETERKPKNGGKADATLTLLQWQEKVSIEFVRQEGAHVHCRPTSRRFSPFPPGLSLGAATFLRNSYFLAHVACLHELQVSQLSAAYRQSESERRASAKRRRERLANFKRTQEQLLHPPKFYRSDKAALSAGHFEDAACEDSRKHHILKIAADNRWAQAEEATQRHRAQRAHALAVAAANARGKKVRSLTIFVVLAKSKVEDGGPLDAILQPAPNTNRYNSATGTLVLLWLPTQATVVEVFSL